jgi:hypothetical protein
MWLGETSGFSAAMAALRRHSAAMEEMAFRGIA